MAADGGCDSDTTCDPNSPGRANRAFVNDGPDSRGPAHRVGTAAVALGRLYGTGETDDIPSALRVLTEAMTCRLVRASNIVGTGGLGRHASAGQPRSRADHHVAPRPARDHPPGLRASCPPLPGPDPQAPGQRHRGRRGEAGEGRQRPGPAHPARGRGPEDAAHRAEPPDPGHPAALFTVVGSGCQNS